MSTNVGSPNPILLHLQTMLAPKIGGCGVLYVILCFFNTYTTSYMNTRPNRSQKSEKEGEKGKRKGDKGEKVTNKTLAQFAR
jgi:hypothetical protein